MAALIISQAMFDAVYGALDGESSIFPLAELHNIKFRVVKSIYLLKKDAEERTFLAELSRNAVNLYSEYQKCCAHDGPKTIIAMSVRRNCSAVHLARCVLQGMFLSKLPFDKARESAKKCVRDPHQIKTLTNGYGIDDSLLSENVLECVRAGAPSQVCVDQLRTNVGREHEVRLAQHLRAVGARFQGDSVLRAMRLSKTPDALLTTPISVRGRVVHWVESKAMFGDPKTMEGHASTQLKGYRGYGPGLVIYWDGMVAEAAAKVMHDFPDVVVSSGFPEDAVLCSRH